jgi:hypothetical protein
MSENTKRNHLWKPGQSGNPNGKPKGARHRTTLAIAALLEGEAQAIGRKAIEKAKEGDTTAMRLCLERLLPPLRDRPVAFEMPPLTTPLDAVKATAAIASAVAEGDLTTGEAAELSKIIDGFVKAFEVHSLDERLKRLEQANERVK